MDDRTSNPRQPIVESTVEARQAVTGHGVRYVLLISLGAVVLLFAILWLGFFAH